MFQTFLHFLGYFSHFRCPSNSFIPYPVHLCNTTHPSQHPHFDHVKLLILRFLHCPCVRPTHHCWSYHGRLYLPSTVKLILRLHRNRYLLLHLWLVPSSGVASKAVYLIPPCCPVCCLVLFRPCLCHVISLFHTSFHLRFVHPFLLFLGITTSTSILLTMCSSFILIITPYTLFLTVLSLYSCPCIQVSILCQCRS